MKRFALMFVMLSLGCQTPTDQTADSTTKPTTCCQAAILERLDPTMPHDLAAGAPLNQCSMDAYSWQAFIALNWPALPNGSGVPDREALFGARGEDGSSVETVWETYREVYEVFQAQARRPCPDATTEAERRSCWNHEKTLNPDYCGDSAYKVLYRTTKIPELLTDFQAIAPTTAQNGFMARVEKRLNWDEFNYIVEHQLYNAEMQASFDQPIDLPVGRSDGPVGAMEIKAGWKRIVECDHPQSAACAQAQARYHTRPVTIYYPNDGRCTETPVVYGLVAFHITSKPQAGGDQHVWSTFEHVDNAPTRGDEIPSAASYSFFNPDCSAEDCPPNTVPLRQGQSYSDADPSPYPPTQVVRLTPIPNPQCEVYSEDQNTINNTQEMNRRMQELFRGTPWEHYRLINTQWTNDQGQQVPPDLRNVVLETYIIDPTQNPADPQSSQLSEQRNASQCIGCHAKTVTKAGRAADLTFLFENEAQCPAGTKASEGKNTSQPCVPL